MTLLGIGFGWVATILRALLHFPDSILAESFPGGRLSAVPVAEEHAAKVNKSRCNEPR
jgi:hypothetical protein